jgi:hypothetical protein
VSDHETNRRLDEIEKDLVELLREAHRRSEPQRVEICIKIELVEPVHTYHPTVGGAITVTGQ